MVHSASFVIEKGLDRKSCGSCAQADVTKFFDRLRISLLLRSLHGIGVHGSLLGGLLRFHLDTSIHLTTGSLDLEISGKHFGVLTGTRSANLLGRIPLEDIINKHGQRWLELGFKMGSN